MSSILYYSKFCTNSTNLLQRISQSTVKDDLHFISVDNRVKKSNGATYIVLDNGQEILLPPTITKVPALLLLNRGHHVLFGEEIDKHIEPQVTAMKQQAVPIVGEPNAFSLGGGGFTNYGVSSDNYSFLDQDADSLSAKGDGGMRQQHHYATLDYSGMIETPPETYQPDKVGNISMEELQEKRQADIPNQQIPNQIAPRK
tara:strand:+ start:1481 stop:2080 length:600 start_codon:yes stop_codon:yes gene_type:complete